MWCIPDLDCAQCHQLCLHVHQILWKHFGLLL